MNSHERVWNAIDLIAESNGKSPSGLAIALGMDATAFNKSKRTDKHGRPRWPSTKTVQKILDHAGLNWRQWGSLVDDGKPARTPKAADDPAASRE
jgi:phage repressor protein C with HTH and peptisase S24 domain